MINDDGRLQFAHYLTENKWDRSFSYDHAGRLTEADTNRKARGQTFDYWNPDPYGLTVSHDVWGNTTSQTGSLYTGTVALNDSATYTNNRRQYWMYDAQGNVTIDASYYHTFDAAGRNSQAISHTNAGDGTTQFPSQPQLEITQTYDGDGASRKRVQTSRQNIYDDWNENHPLVQVLEDTQTSYYVKSTVLGGARVVELDANGNKKSVWIYAGGQRIAKEENGGVNFEHHNPATGGWLETNGHSSSRITLREERDPRNAEIPLTNPYPTGSYISMKWEEPLLIEGGDPFDRNSGLELDGMPISESQLAHMMDTGAAVGALFIGGRYAGALDFSGHGAMGLRYLRGDFGALRITTSFADVSSTFREWDSGAIIDTGQETTSYPQLVNAPSEYGQRRFAHAPQNTGQTPRDTRSSNQKACDDKIAGIFGGSGAEAATVAEPTTLLSPNRNRNPSATYDHLAGGGVFHLYTNAQGTEATVGLYRPPGGRLVSGGEYDNGGQTENYFRYSYTKGPLKGVTLSFVHVGGTHGGEVGGQYLGSFPGEPLRVGNIGGPGGAGFGYNHTHVKVFYNGKLTDPRKIFCKGLGF